MVSPPLLKACKCACMARTEAGTCVFCAAGGIHDGRAGWRGPTAFASLRELGVKPWMGRDSPKRTASCHVVQARPLGPPLSSPVRKTCPETQAGDVRLPNKQLQPSTRPGPDISKSCTVRLAAAELTNFSVPRDGEVSFAFHWRYLSPANVGWQG